MSFDDWIQNILGADGDDVPATGAVEPPAGMRTMAAQTYQSFVAYREAGFSEEQALALTINMVNISVAISLRGGD
jgi:hypothetical protein